MANWLSQDIGMGDYIPIKTNANIPRILDAGFWIQDRRSWILEPGSWMHDTGPKILDPRFRTLDPRSKTWLWLKPGSGKIRDIQGEPRVTTIMILADSDYWP